MGSRRDLGRCRDLRRHADPPARRPRSRCRQGAGRQVVAGRRARRGSAPSSDSLPGSALRVASSSPTGGECRPVAHCRRGSTTRVASIDPVGGEWCRAGRSAAGATRPIHSAGQAPARFLRPAPGRLAGCRSRAVARPTRRCHPTLRWPGPGASWSLRRDLAPPARPAAPPDPRASRDSFRWVAGMRWCRPTPPIHTAPLVRRRPAACRPA